MQSGGRKRLRDKRAIRTTCQVEETILKRPMYSLAAVISGAFLLFSAAHAAPSSNATAAKFHDDDVVGAVVELQDDWEIKRDPVLFENTHGFAIYSAMNADGKAHTGHDRDAIARIAIAHKAHPHEFDNVVATKLAQYRDLNPTRTEIRVPGAQRAVLITGLPGARPYSIVYAWHGNHVYEIGLWSDNPGLDAKGKALLNKIKFKPPGRSVESLGLEDAKTAAYRQPPMDQQIRNAQAYAQRRDEVNAARANGDLSGNTITQQASSGTCGFTAPTSLYWQLQWDNSNTFYSGSWYNLRSTPGWSAMSGNYGSWWGTNYHVGLCYTERANQYYANDWPGQYWANAYAAFSGYVEWAGWGTDGFYTLGNYVVVRNGSYRNVTAHLSGIANGVHWGAYIDGYYKVIGWVGSTGGDWAPHIHARVSWGEKLTYNGQPYGGQSVRPARLRCFACKNQDVTTSAGAKYYTQFWHGRWMKY